MPLCPTTKLPLANEPVSDREKDDDGLHGSVEMLSPGRLRDMGIERPRRLAQLGLRSSYKGAGSAAVTKL